MGAWIEIKKSGVRFWQGIVAPRVGAWIEICECGISCFDRSVAPRVGAWIEIRRLTMKYKVIKSRSPRGGVD